MLARWQRHSRWSFEISNRFWFLLYISYLIDGQKTNQTSRHPPHPCLRSPQPGTCKDRHQSCLTTSANNDLFSPQKNKHSPKTLAHSITQTSLAPIQANTPLPTTYQRNAVFFNLFVAAEPYTSVKITHGTLCTDP